METIKTNQELAEKVSKEKKPFLFVYRENDLFKKYVPFIQNFLIEQGYPVNLQSFLVGTPEEEIKEWYLAHQTEIQAKNILADNTSIRSCGRNQKTFHSNLKSKINLDKLMNKSTTEAITGDADFVKHLNSLGYAIHKYPEKKQEYLLALGETYKKILTSIPEEKRQKMEVVILKGLFRGDNVSASLIAHEPYCPNSHAENFDFEDLSKETNEFANKMEEWLKSSGISKVTTFLIGAEIPPETIKKLTTKEAYIILDRHSWYKNRCLGDMFTEKLQKFKKDIVTFWGNNFDESDQIEAKSSLRTPIETFYDDVQEKIGINADPQKLEESIKKILQNELAETEK